MSEAGGLVLDGRLMSTVLVAVAMFAAAACGGGGGDTTTTTSTPPPATTTTTPPETTSEPPETTVPAETTTTAAAETTTTAAEGTATVLIASVGAMADTWEETLFIPYGEGDDQLGTAPGGEGLTLGPEYGTQTADGTWWFLDAAKQRIARYDASGQFMDALPVPADILVDGQYFQYQIPSPLDDGTVAAGSLNTGRLLVVGQRDMSTVPLDRSVSLTTTDGESLFGFEIGTDSIVRVDPATGASQPVDAFRTRAGTSYTFAIERGEATRTLPDTGVTGTILLRWADDPESIVLGGVEVESAPDGTLHVLFYGVPEVDESQQVAGIFSITPDGAVSEADALTNPFTPADPGSPAHLGVDLVTGQPWFMVVGTDGVRVYLRTG
ncbi:MAG TPA: hypothetical protein VGC47_07940 [Acidimicrobiia bacterium]|jgi:hypothetical protein